MNSEPIYILLKTYQYPQHYYLEHELVVREVEKICGDWCRLKHPIRGGGGVRKKIVHRSNIIKTFVEKPVYEKR